MNTKLKIILPVFMSALLFLAEAIVLFAVSKLEILPCSYFLILTVLLLFLWVILTLLLVLPSRKVKKTRAVIACILSVVMIAGCAGLTNVIGQFYETMHTITGTTNKTTEYTVYVLAEDPAKGIADAKSYTFGVCYLSGDDTLNKGLLSLDKALATSVTTSGFTSVPEMVNALYLGQVEAIILDSAYVALLEEFEQYADFQSRVKALYVISVVEDVITPTEPPTQLPTGTNTEPKPDDDNVEPYIIYISGSDTRNATLSKSRSDVNILVVINPKTNQILLLNTPRDYYVPNPAGNGALDKLTHCGIFGVDCSRKALADLYGASVEYHAQFNFIGFKTMIDAIGGITVYSDYAFTSENYSFVVGPNEMDGEKALVFARTRSGLPGGDNARGQNQMKVIRAVIDKLTSTSALISNYSEIMSSLQGMFQTNFPVEKISQLVKMQLSNMSAWNIQSFAVTGSGSSKTTFSMPGQYVYVMIPDENTVTYATELIDRVLSGDILTAEDMVVPAE